MREKDMQSHTGGYGHIYSPRSAFPNPLESKYGLEFRFLRNSNFRILEREGEGATMNDCRVEEALLPADNKLTDEDSGPSPVYKWRIIILNCTLCAIGNVGGPLLTRLYYQHGGSRQWLCTWLQSVGFPVLLIPIAIIYMRNRNTLASAKLMSYSLAIGLLLGIMGLAYSSSLLLLPLSTATLIMSTSLVFTALFARCMVGQKLTAFTITAVVLMTAGAALLGIGNKSSRNLLVGNFDPYYLAGFFLALLASAITGFMSPCSEYAYAKTKEPISYSVVLQYIVGNCFVSTIFATVGMLVNKDFQAIPKEASDFGLGPTVYYVILVSSALVWPTVALGTFGLVVCTSALFSGIFVAFMLPAVEFAALLAFHETFTIEKLVSLVLCLAGFAAYFYGIYREESEQKQTPEETD